MKRKDRFKCGQCPARFWILEDLRDHFDVVHLGLPRGDIFEILERDKVQRMGFLSRKDIVSAAPRFAVREVSVQDWGGGGKVLIQGGSGEDRDEYESTILTGKGKHRDVNLRLVRRKLVSMACVEAPEGFAVPPDGMHERLPRLFTESDVETLASLSGRDMSAVFSEAQELWGLKPEDVEELAGELKPSQKGASGTALPGNGASRESVLNGT